MKVASIVVTLIGLAVVAALVAHFGAGAVARSMSAIGGAGFIAVCLVHLGLIGAMGIAWSALLPEPRPAAAVWARLVRDSASEVLPLSQVGGYVLGARTLVLAGVAGNAAAASTIVDVTLEFCSQLAFTAIGLLWLLHLAPHAAAVVPAAIGLVVAVFLAGGCLFVQQRGLAASGRLAGAIGRGWTARTAAGAAALHAAIVAIYRRRVWVWGSFLLHLACWIAGVVEVWLALRLMGVPRGFGVVLVIESLLYALRSVAFAVPNAVGVQEAGYLLLGAGFGLAPDAALALSLLKRGRDFAIGLPVLGVYQLVEGGRLWRRPAPAAAGVNPQYRMWAGVRDLPPQIRSRRS
jgi:putative membrane protein